MTDAPGSATDAAMAAAAAASGTGRVVPAPFGEIDDRAEQVMVPMRDGVRLATDVYVPKGVPAPVILIRLPYDKARQSSFVPAIARYVGERGYCLVAQDVRGKIRSEGQTFAFTSEMRDGADTLDWIESQRWCDGSVVMFGDSYYGFTQWAAAASGHRALRAIVPRNTTTEIGTDWMYHQGVFCLETMLGWAADTWSGHAQYEFPGGIDWTHRPLAGLVTSMFDGRLCPTLTAGARHPPAIRSGLPGSTAAAILARSDSGAARGRIVGRVPPGPDPRLSQCFRKRSRSAPAFQGK